MAEDLNVKAQRSRGNAAAHLNIAADHARDGELLRAMMALLNGAADLLEASEFESKK